MKTEILNFKCVGLSDGGKFPIKYTGRGQDISPEFILENLSPEAKTLAVVLEDLSHPIKGFTHWVIWNIPAADRIGPAVPSGRTVPSLGARSGDWAMDFTDMRAPSRPGEKPMCTVLRSIAFPKGLI